MEKSLVRIKLQAIQHRLLLQPMSSRVSVETLAAVIECILILTREGE